MRSIWAMAGVTLRGAVRSRVVLLLLLLLAVAVIGLPLTTQDDGTIGGRIQVLVGLTLGAVGSILAMTALWAGCASISTEITDHRIHLLVTKPVWPLQIWLGKWLGLLLLLALLLGASGLILFASLRWAIRPSALSPEQQTALHRDAWVCRASATPVVRGFREAFAAALEDWKQANPGVEPSATIRDLLRSQVESRAFLVSPGEARSWTVRLPAVPRPGKPIRLQFRMIKSRLDLEPVSGIWVLGSPRSAAPVELRGSWRPQTLVTVEFPPDPALRDRDLVLGFVNLDPSNPSLLFDPDQGLTVLMEYGAFETNLFRALLLLYFRLAFLAAVGIAAGALFSFPVASLCAFTLALLLHLNGEVASLAEQGRYLGRGQEDGATVVLLDRGLHAVYAGLDRVFRPLAGPGPVQAAAGGRWISWRRTAESFVLHLGLYSGVLALLSTTLFRRRELGAPP